MWQTECCYYRNYNFCPFCPRLPPPLRPMWMEQICVIYTNKSFSAQYENTACLRMRQVLFCWNTLLCNSQEKKSMGQMSQNSCGLPPAPQWTHNSGLYSSGTATDAKLIEKVHTLFLFLEKCSFSYFPLTGFSRVAFISTRLKFAKKRKEG